MRGRRAGHPLDGGVHRRGHGRLGEVARDRESRRRPGDGRWRDGRLLDRPNCLHGRRRDGRRRRTRQKRRDRRARAPWWKWRAVNILKNRRVGSNCLLDGSARGRRSSELHRCRGSLRHDRRRGDWRLNRSRSRREALPLECWGRRHGLLNGDDGWGDDLARARSGRIGRHLGHGRRRDNARLLHRGRLGVAPGGAARLLDEREVQRRHLRLVAAPSA